MDFHSSLRELYEKNYNKKEKLRQMIITIGQSQ